MDARCNDIAQDFELRFNALTSSGRALALACDKRGTVDLNAVSDRARSNYLFACALLGRKFSVPAVQRALLTKAGTT
jgi:hypothetical protein